MAEIFLENENRIHDPANLDDDKQPTGREFEGATLQIGREEDVERGIPDIYVAQPSLSRDRPGSVLGRTSVRSTGSRTSVKPGLVKSDVSSQSFYSYKDGHLQKAVSNVRNIIKPELDGDLKSYWLLTEIDHWDLERERIVLLTDYSLFIVKYNFITEQLLDYRRIMLHVIHNICIGDLTYPNSSLMPDRKHGGVRIYWDRGDQLSFGQKWNPWCSDIPWVTLSHHPLLYNPKENETTTFNVDDFFDALVAATSKVFAAKRPGETLKVIEGPITIESYASLIALIYNKSEVGYFRDRSWFSL
ncbi:unnamed protein product [Candidula unifasciata]|uniref:HSac2 domain-containing protein n=1 Tax=Candidula unifasciata TaxID=100452 RepID=A0A8S3YTS6_9EUPU|nr:unnamed protein product [Candidula unifasciata]